MTTKPAALLATFIAAFTLTSCGATVPDHTITAEQATARVEQHIHDVAAAIPGANLKREFPTAVTPCTAPVDGGPLGRVAAGANYRIVDLPPDDNAAAFDLAYRYWTDHGFRILEDLRSQGYLWAEAPDPDFTTIALSESGKGTRILFLVSSSPCVWPNGTRPGR